MTAAAVGRRSLAVKAGDCCALEPARRGIRLVTQAWLIAATRQRQLPRVANWCCRPIGVRRPAPKLTYAQPASFTTRIREAAVHGLRRSAMS
jgi:hypothetical protein